MARTSIATDNFNRSSLGTSNWAQLNTALGGDVKITASTKIVGQFALQSVHQACVARWIGAGTFTSDQYSKVAIDTIANVSTNSGIGAVCRASSDTGANKDFYELYVDGGVIGGNVYLTSLAKWVNGTRTVLYSNNETWVNTDTVELECEGTTIRGMRNGSSLGSSWIVTDSSIATGNPGVTTAGTGIIIGDDWEGGNIAAADVTPPNLTSPTGTQTGSTTASGTVSTDDATGTLYYLASTNATETAATVKAASSQAVTATGSQSVSVTGLTASTTYYMHYCHRDPAGNDSTVANSASFTTAAAGSTYAPNINKPRSGMGVNFYGAR